MRPPKAELASFPGIAIILEPSTLAHFFVSFSHCSMMSIQGEKGMSLQPDDLFIHPLAEAHTLPAASYIDSSHHVLEKKRVLDQHWLYVTHESRLPKAGDYYSDVIN